MLKITQLWQVGIQAQVCLAPKPVTNLDTGQWPPRSLLNDLDFPPGKGEATMCATTETLPVSWPHSRGESRHHNSHNIVKYMLAR